mgnify:CR=1 FL=1
MDGPKYAIAEYENAHTIPKKPENLNTHIQNILQHITDRTTTI